MPSRRVDPVGAVNTVGERVQRAVVDTGGREKAGVGRVVPDVVWYDATYVVFAFTAIGVAKLTCCQPEAVSPLNVAVPSEAPVADHRWAVCVPVLVTLL